MASLSELYADSMVRLTDLTAQYNKLVQASQSVSEENKKLKEEIEELKKPQTNKKTK